MLIKTLWVLRFLLGSQTTIFLYMLGFLKASTFSLINYVSMVKI